MDNLITVLQFFFISTSSNISPKEFKFYFGSEKEEVEHELDGKNQIKFNPKYSSSLIYYVETITVKYKKKEILFFQFFVYIGKKNNIIIDLDEKSRPSFELLFYSKEIQFNPVKLSYKNKEYDQFENYGNKFRSRIFFVNVDPEQLQYINSEKIKEGNLNFNNNNTYQVLLRIINHNKFEVSMTDMEYYIEKYMHLDDEENVLSGPDLEDLEQILNDFYEKYKKYMSINPILIAERQSSYAELKTSAEKICNNHNLYKYIDEPGKNKFKEYLPKTLELFHIDFFLSEFTKLNEANAINQYELNNLNISQVHTMEEKLYKQLKEDKDLNIYQKVQILKTVTLFYCKSLLMPGKLLDLNYIHINDNTKQTPYYKSISMLQNIISNITEESRLFEAFMYFDSHIIQNILIRNTQINYVYEDIFGQNIEVTEPEYITEYGMSLMTLNEIKSHLMDLMPSLIVKIDSTMNLRGLFEKKTKMMVINEYKMFHTITESDKKIFYEEPDYYVVPISMEVMHEILGHAKLRYIQEIDSSPLALRDSKNNFKLQKLMKKVKLNFAQEAVVNKGETGRVLEYYISEDKRLIQLLKEKNFNTEIVKAKYWTGKNFDDLHNALEFKKNNMNNSHLLEDILLDCDDDDEIYDCAFS